MQNNAMRQRVLNEVGNTPMKSYDRERLHRSVNYQSYVNGYALSQAGYGFLVGSCGGAAYFAAIGLKNGVSYPFLSVALIALLIGGFAAGAFGMIFLISAKASFAELMTEYEGAEFETPQEASPQRDVMIYNGQAIDKTRQDVMVDKFRFHGANLDELHRRYLRGVDRVKRDSSNGANDGFNTLPIPYTTATYATAKAILEKNGFIENSKWTPKGVAFIKGE